MNEPRQQVDAVQQAVNDVATKEAAELRAKQLVAQAAMATGLAHPFRLKYQDDAGRDVDKPCLLFIPPDLTEAEAFAYMGEVWKALREVSIEAELKSQSALQKAGLVIPHGTLPPARG